MPEDSNDSRNGHGTLQATWTVSDISWVLGMYRRYWLLVVTMILLALAGAILMAIARGPQYEVGAALYLKLGAEMAPPASIAKEPVMVTRRTEDVNTEIEFLRSPHLIRQVVQTLGEDFFADDPPQTSFQKAKRFIKAQLNWARAQVDLAMIKVGLRRQLSEMERVELVLAQALTVEPVRNSDIIYVTLTVPEPKGGELILQKILDAYLESHLSAHKNPGLSEFFTSQTEYLRDELTRNGRSLLSFKSENELWSTDEQRSLLLERERMLQQEHAATLVKIASLDAESSRLKSALAELPESLELSRTLQHNPALADLEAQRTNLALNSEAIAASYSESSPERITAQQQLSYLTNRLANAEELVPFSTTTGMNQSRAELAKLNQAKSAELAGLSSKLKVESEQLKEIAAKLQSLEKSIAHFRELSREHDLLERNYLLYSESAEKSRIATVMNQSHISNVSVVTPPTASLSPVAPRLKYILGGGVFVGFALASALALVLESRRERSHKKAA